MATELPSAMPPLGEQRPDDDDAAEKKQNHGLVRRDAPDHAQSYEGAEDQHTDADDAADDVYDGMYVHNF